jgi:LytS/YehU family sensor histidine kinase
MLLQPLIENAVRYGVAPLVEGGSISIESSILADRLVIVIDNSGRRDDDHAQGGNGIGLGNTAERLKTFYGVDHRFLLEWPESGGCRVTVELPLRRSDRLEEIISCAP